MRKSIALIVLLLSVFSNAYLENKLTFEVNDYVFEVLSDEEVRVVLYYGDESNVVIPEEIGKYRVVSIGDYAFSPYENNLDGLTNIQNVYIPASITDMGKNPFMECYKLENIIVDSENSHFTVIDQSLICRDDLTLITCFSNNQQYIIPDSIHTIGVDSFYCGDFETITIPSNTKTILDYAFWGCSLTTVNMNQGIQQIGESAFEGCSNLEHVYIPDGVLSIGAHAFAQCDSLIDIRISGSVSEIGEDIISIYPWFNGYELNTYTTVLITKGSFAEKYCIENNLNMKYIE